MLWVCIWDNLWLKCTASMMHLGLYHSEVYNFCMRYVRTTRSWRNLCDAAMQTFAPVSSVGEFVKSLFCYRIARYKISFLLVKVSKWKKQNLFSVNPACTSFLRYTNVWQQGEGRCWTCGVSTYQVLATKSPKASGLEGNVAIALSKALQTDGITEQGTKKLSKVPTVKRNHCYHYQ